MRRSAEWARRLAVAGLTVAIAGSVLGSAGTVHAAEPADKTEAVITQLLSSHGIPGAQVVHRKGDALENYNFGIQSTATGVAVEDDTLFQVASLSKVVGAYVFMKRVDQGVIDLDTPLWDYYQSPRIASSDEAKLVTARMVLNHMTGFPNWAGASGDETTELVPLTEPGSQFGYSGDGFFLLQTVIEHLEGKTFSQILRDEVFDPFGMTNSTLEFRAVDEEKSAVGHGEDGAAAELKKYTRGNTAYTLQTTALDYTMFLQRAVIDGEGLSPQAHELWLTASSDADRGDGNAADPFINWGLGVGLEDNELGAAVWHWGDNGDRRAFSMAFPDRDESVMIVWNSTNGQLSANDILKEFFGDVQFSAITWVGEYPETPAATFPDSDEWPELASAVQPIIDEAADAGIDVGVTVEDLTGYYDDRSLYLGKQDHFTTASTIKMSLAATVMRQVQNGDLSLDDAVTITQDDRYDGTGLLKDGPFPQEVTVGRMLELMITVSDNTATNKLVDVVGGFAPINALTESAGISRGDLHFGRKMFGPIVPPDGDIWLSPYGMNQLMTLLYDVAEGVEVLPEFLSAESVTGIIDLMLKQQVDTKLGAVIPREVLAHKTGENDDVSHDVGLLLVPEQEITLSVFSTRQADFTGDVQATANPYLQRIGTAVYDYVLATAPATPVDPTPVDPDPIGPDEDDPGAPASAESQEGGALAATGMDAWPLVLMAGGALVLMLAGAMLGLARRRAAASR